MLTPIPEFTNPSYGDQTTNELQRMVNLYPEQTLDGWKLITTPGYTLFGTLDVARAIRGAYYSTTGQLFAVVYDTVYEIDNVGAKTSRGSVTAGTGLVSMADNGIQLLIVDASTSGWYLTMSAGSATLITDIHFLGGSLCAFLDGYLIAARPSTGEIYLSQLLSASNWTSTVTPTANLFATAESIGDTLVGVFSDGQRVYLLGKQSLEIWYNTARPGFPFERINGATKFIGCPNTALASQFKDRIFFVGGSKTGKGAVWTVIGTDIQKISNPYIESIVSTFDTDAAFSIAYQIDGNDFYEITGTTAGKSLVFNATNNTWFEKSSVISGTPSYDNIRFIVNAFDTTYGRVVGFAGGSASYMLYMSNSKNSEDTGTPVSIVRTRIFGPIESKTKQLFHNQIRFEVDIKYGATGSTSIAPTLDWTDDGGLTYATARTMTTTVTNSITGQRVIFTENRLGMSASRYYRLKFTGPDARIILRKCEIDLREGGF